jgi:hypothetical protein
MTTKLEYYARQVYGATQFYIVDAAMAHNISRLTGHKTLTRDNSEALKALGFELIQVIDPASSLLK